MQFNLRSLTTSHFQLMNHFFSAPVQVWVMKFNYVYAVHLLLICINWISLGSILRIPLEIHTLLFTDFFWFDLPCCFNQLTMVRWLTRYRNHPSLHSTDKRRGKKDKKCIFTRCLVTSAGSLLEEQRIHGLCLNPSHDEPGTRKCMQTVAVIYNAILGLNSCSFRPQFVQV